MSFDVEKGEEMFPNSPLRTGCKVMSHKGAVGYVYAMTGPAYDKNFTNVLVKTGKYDDKDSEVRAVKVRPYPNQKGEYWKIDDSGFFKIVG